MIKIQQKRNWTVIVLIFLFFIIHASLDGQHAKKKKTESYLPLNKGNRWKYLRKINHNLLEEDFMSSARLEPDKFYIAPFESDRLDEESFEEYIVGDKVLIENNPYWEIKVNPDNARDCRYEGAVKILWGKVPPGEKKEVKILFNEWITYNPDAKKFEILKMWYEIKKWEHISPFLLDADPDELEGRLTLEEITFKENLIISGNSVKIQVPAGIFENCLEIIREFIGKGWKTYSYFAKNVGMVKEVRKKANGDIIYSLELMDFTIAPKR